MEGGQAADDLLRYDIEDEEREVGKWRLDGSWSRT
jgi:hypothetical protein